MRRISLLLSGIVMLGWAVALSACNTVAGAGQDVKATGQAVTNGAQSTKQAITNP